MYYKKVYIEGKEENLPKGVGNYLAYQKNGNARLLHFPFDGDVGYDIFKLNWIEDVDWYLLPDPSVELLKELCAVQKVIIDRKCQHTPHCYQNQNWQEAIDALNDTPVTYRDEGWYEALNDVFNRMKQCSCGLTELRQKIETLTKQMEE